MVANLPVPVDNYLGPITGQPTAIPFPATSALLPSMTKKHRKGQAHDGPGLVQASKEQEVFFGNISKSMPEALFLEIVREKVGDIANVKANKPSAVSWGLIGPPLCNKALTVMCSVCLHCASLFLIVNGKS